VAPYAAPEARETGEVGSDTDVYSVGVILTELLTGRRPRRSNPAQALEDVPPVPEELRALVARSLAPSGERFPTIVEMRHALEEILTASPYALYTGNLALFLYRLLNPEGQNVVDAADGDATHPVESGARAVEPDLAPLLPPFETALPMAIVPFVPFERSRAEPRFHVAMAVLPAPAQLAPPKGTVWIGRVGFAVAASLVAVGVFFPGHRSESAREPSAAATLTAGGSPTAVPTDAFSAALFPVSLVGLQAPQPARDDAAGSGSASRARASVGAIRRLASARLARRSTESLRLRAALARIEAERLDASVIARDLYAEAQGKEKEGNLLLRQGAYQPAQPALMRATQLYRMAEDVSREERVRMVRLSSPQ
ncbi:MAG TPA: hypothetical protein VGS00_00300, partial [Thermoanaerobaculia bacterium]|nr:hypothetical protein [Thermoanaerobaculia bacterium]